VSTSDTPVAKTPAVKNTTTVAVSVDPKSISSIEKYIVEVLKNSYESVAKAIQTYSESHGKDTKKKILETYKKELKKAKKLINTWTEKVKDLKKDMAKKAVEKKKDEKKDKKNKKDKKEGKKKK
jgi:uncharacterized membrane-anchored protein